MKIVFRLSTHTHANKADGTIIWYIDFKRSVAVIHIRIIIKFYSKWDVTRVETKQFYHMLFSMQIDNDIHVAAFLPIIQQCMLDFCAHQLFSETHLRWVSLSTWNWATFFSLSLSLSMYVKTFFGNFIIQILLWADRMSYT